MNLLFGEINKSGIRTDSSLVETGWFGINLHAGGTGSNVKNWSAGCQIIWGGRDACLSICSCKMSNH